MKFDELDKKIRVFETAHDICVSPRMFMIARIIAVSRKTFMKRISLTAKAVFLLCVSVCGLQAQITDTTSGERYSKKTQEIQQAEARVNLIINESEKFFKQGEINIKDGRLKQAWSDFDKSIEVILISGTNVKKNTKLNDYYLQLVERIYSAEMLAKKKSVRNKESEIKFSPACLELKSNDKTNINVAERLAQAINFYKNGDDDEALNKLRYVLADQPMNAAAYLMVGKIHFRRGDKEQAVISLKTALFWDNRLIDASILLGKIYFEKGDIPRAKNYSADALAIDSNNNRAQSLARLVEGGATAEDRRTIENDSTEIEKLLQETSRETIVNASIYSDIIWVAPFKSDNDDDSLAGDFAYILSEVLPSYGSLCVVKNKERENLVESFGFDTDETFTLATSIKLAKVSKSNLLIVGKYKNTPSRIDVVTKVIRVNEGSFLSEELPDGRKFYREFDFSDSPSNLRVLQGQIAYRILFQRDKALPYSQNELIEAVLKIKIPANLNIVRNSASELDFSTNNSLKKTICNDNTLGNLQLRNFRLGITYNEAIKTLPKATVKNINLYEKRMSQNFSAAVVKDERFKDISFIQLQFYENRLYSIEIIYDDNIKWRNLSEFVSQVEKSLDLPAMKNGRYEFDGKYLFCGNYQIKVMMVNYKTPAIHLFDTTIFDKIMQRRQEDKNKIEQQKIEEEKRKRQIEEEKKKLFKP